ncbi:polymer-forming cytoskeletal protein, partial [Rhodococcus rhodochrous]
MANWYERDNTLQIASSNMDKLKIDRTRNVVVVPAGTTIDGDLVVRNGNVEVQGEVRGNVVAIEGKVVLASTAHVAGSAESIEAIFEWIWYEVKNIGND